MAIRVSSGHNREIFVDLNGLNVRSNALIGVYLTYEYAEFTKINYKQPLKKLENTVNWCNEGQKSNSKRAEHR